MFSALFAWGKALRGKKKHLLQTVLHREAQNNKNFRHPYHYWEKWKQKVGMVFVYTMSSMYYIISNISVLCCADNIH